MFVFDYYWEESLEKWEILEVLMVLKVDGVLDGDVVDVVVIECVVMCVVGSVVVEYEMYSFL